MLALDNPLIIQEMAKTCMPLLAEQLASEALKRWQRLNSLSHLLLIGTYSGEVDISGIRKEALFLLLESNQQLSLALKTLTDQ